MHSLVIGSMTTRSDLHSDITNYLYIFRYLMISGFMGKKKWPVDLPLAMGLLYWQE
jgi:hypothetical protein